LLHQVNPKNLRRNPLLLVKTKAHSTAPAVTSHHASAMEKTYYAAAAATAGRLLRLPIGADAPPQPAGSSHGAFPFWHLCPEIMIPMSRPPQHQARRTPSPSSTHSHPLGDCPGTTATMVWDVCDLRP
jgi:hypothetical protein